MSSSGGGTGTPISPPSFPSVVYDQTEELSYIPNCAVSLSRYAKIINYEESAFWGVTYDNQILAGCDPLWTESQRFDIQNALAEAQQEVEEQLNYPLCPTWVAGTLDDELNHNDRWVDQQTFRSSLLTRYPRLISAGIRAVTTVGSSSAITHGPTVGVIGPLATDALTTEEIHVYYPDSDREITPSKITISGGTVTIEIPRYRMVIQSLLNTPKSGIKYESLSNFLTAVDVKRIYTDTSVNAILVRGRCKNNQCQNGCGECTRPACIYIRDPYIGQIDISPADWDADAQEWSSRVICAGNYSRVRLNYVCGLRYLNLKAEIALIRLAHSKLGKPPCQCDRTNNMWSGDYAVPNILTRERINCPFGYSNGAFLAWKWAMSLASRRASVL